jgi:hypothetical protein
MYLLISALMSMLSLMPNAFRFFSFFFVFLLFKCVFAMAQLCSKLAHNRTFTFLPTSRYEKN